MTTITTSELREIKIERDYVKFADASVLISFGDTKVLCTATIENRVPPFLKDQGKGWITAEYSMLPGSTNPRVRRELNKGKPSGRTQEIQRLIGRSLRAVVDLEALGERSILIDADVLQADGGTRTASITGGMIVLQMAIQKLMAAGEIKQNPIREWLAAISAGIHNGEPVLDLCYEQDSTAEVDMNVVMTQSGRFIEIQGTAEQDPFTPEQLTEMLALAKKGITQLIEKAQYIG